MSPVRIIGAGGHSRVVFDVVKRLMPDREVLWHDEAWKSMTPVGPIKNIASLEALLSINEPQDCFVAIGNCANRMKLIEVAASHGHRLISLVDPDATVSSFATIDGGSVVMAAAVIQTAARLGTGVIVNTAASVDHDCVLGDGVHIAPGAHLAGNVSVGSGSWIGIGAVVREGVAIGSGVVVGAGAVVIDDIPDEVTVVGNPARNIRRPGRHP